MLTKASFNKLTVVAVCATLFGFLDVSMSSAIAQGKSQSKTASVRTEVKVYFYHDPGEYIDLSPVTRIVNAVTPARAAVDGLLKGPTAQEEKRGFGSLVSASDFRIESLKIEDGTAVVNFVPTPNWHGWPGDLGPVRFKKAVELTLKQFATVKKVIVSLNGDKDFDAEP
jgi:spore germination protein GerM